MARAKKQYIVDEQGRKTAVVLPIQEYEQLLEDLEDLAIIAERRNEPTEPLEAVLDRLEKKWQSTESR
jgi:PHD/YefM family antitoxin component YafN of YafNO toxin-antitoxin module